MIFLNNLMNNNVFFGLKPDKYQHLSNFFLKIIEDKYPNVFKDVFK